MLETKQQIGSAPQNPTQSVLAFKPRQVLLAHKNSATTTAINTTGMTMKQGSTIRTLNLDQKALLLHSVLCYLDFNGFSKPLKRLISDAQIQDDSWKTCLLNLEDMFLHYLETCTNTDAKPDTSKEQELNDSKKDGRVHSSVVEEAVVKKKKSKGDENDSGAVVADNERADSDVELKPKKKSTKPSDSAQETEQVSDRATKEQKDKKKKSKYNSEMLESNVQQVQLDSSQVEKEVKSKDKKKKSKLSRDSVVENVEHSEKVELVSPSSKGDGEADTDVEGKSKDKKKKKKKHSEKVEIVSPSSKGDGEADTDPEGKLKDKKKKQDSDLVVENTDIPQQGEIVLPKDKKKKKKKVDSTPEMLSGDTKVPNKKGIMENNPERGPVLTAKECNEDEKKDSKKRKRSASVENGVYMPNANGNDEKNGEETAARKSRRKEVNDSVEPKNVNSFQRVKIDEVQFADERLQDNSYWAKDGAEIGYGAKAQEILGQVRGRDFRHEKTKKKRGSYRGGQIDLQTHSVKFNYSDED